MQKFNAQYAAMQFLVYRSVPFSVPCVFWKYEVRERLGLKIGGRGTAFPCVLWHFNHCSQRQALYASVNFHSIFSIFGHVTLTFDLFAPKT